MERIRLTKSEKAVLRMIANGVVECPAEYPLHLFNGAVRMLQQKQLIHVAFAEGGSIVDVRLTDYGKQYVAEYPHLANPINWNTLIAIIGVLVSIIALCVACNKL